MKETLPKFTNLDLHFYEKEVILKDKLLFQCTSDIRIKLKLLEQQKSAASLNETETNMLYNREQDREVKAQERERRRDKACPDAGCPPEKPYDNPQDLKGKGMRRVRNLWTGRTLGQRVSKSWFSSV